MGGGNVVLLLLALVPFVLMGMTMGRLSARAFSSLRHRGLGTSSATRGLPREVTLGCRIERLMGLYLVGGYYEAGDNVKFGLPMAFTMTMMFWSIVEYSKQMSGSGELCHAMDAVKWGTKYIIKAHPEPDVLYGEVGALHYGL